MMRVQRTRRWVTGLLYAAWLVILWPAFVLADKVVMNNGDQLSGTVVAMADKKLVFNTPYASNIVIDWKMVDHLSTEGMVEVTLPKDRYLKGRVVSSDADVMTLQTQSERAPRLIRIAEIRELKSLADEGKWKIGGMVAGGLIVQTGNTDKQALGFDVQLDITRKPHRFGLFADLNYEKNDGVLTDDNMLLNANYDHFLNHKWFLFVNDRFNRDKFASLTAQNAFSVGGGYQFWRSPEKNLSFRLGPSIVYQGYSGGQSFLNGADSRTYAAAFWAINFDTWVYKRILQFFHNSNGVFSFQDGQNWGILTRTGLRVPLFWKLFATFQYNYDYAGQPADGRKPDDGKLITRLGLKW